MSYEYGNATITVGNCITHSNRAPLLSAEDIAAHEYMRHLQQGLRNGLPNVVTSKEPTLTGHKPIVICNGTTTECKDLVEAQAKAEELAHKHGADAYVLKPVTKVSPKRDVVTTALK